MSVVVRRLTYFCPLLALGAVMGCAANHDHSASESHDKRDEAINETIAADGRSVSTHIAKPAPMESLISHAPYIGRETKQAINLEPSSPHTRMTRQWRQNKADNSWRVNFHNEKYAANQNNPIKSTHVEPVSTFSIDVDTGSYANVRRFIHSNQLPPVDAVRVEELINYFSYDYATPKSASVVFSVTTETAITPWNAKTRLLQIGLKGFEVPARERPAANLVFLLDVSGSMKQENKLPLLKKSFGVLTENLTHDDRVSIVAYAGASGIVLDPTPGDDHNKILSAMSDLRAGGSTNGAAGINLAYQLARDAFIQNGINRIILATDGDFNVGVTDFESLLQLAKQQKQDGISLTTLGFGTGNYNDHLMEQLADAGDGNHTYIDSLQEARKFLVNEMTSTLLTIAKDVKVQIEFNPAVVEEYRLIGYQNRILKERDFTDDRVDAGEIGAGHSVTALYEIKLTNQAKIGLAHTDELAASLNHEIGFLKLRYKQPGEQISKEISSAIEKPQSWDLKHASDNLKFASAVAAYGQILKQNPLVNGYTLQDVKSLAYSASASDPFGYRKQFIDMVERTEHLTDQWPGQITDQLTGRITRQDHDSNQMVHIQ